MFLDSRWRGEVLEDDGLWHEVKLSTLQRWQVFRLFDEDGGMVRYRHEQDGSPVFVALGSAAWVCAAEGIMLCVDSVPIRGAPEGDVMRGDGTIFLDTTEVQDRARQRQMQIAMSIGVGAEWTSVLDDMNQEQSALVSGDGTINRFLAKETNVASYPMAQWMHALVKKGLAQQREWRKQLSQEVDIWCTCGGRGPDDAEWCQACQLYYLVTGDSRGSVRR